MPCLSSPGESQLGYPLSDRRGGQRRLWRAVVGGWQVPTLAHCLLFCRWLLALFVAVQANEVNHDDERGAQ